MFQSPKILSCGLFDSSVSFPNMKKSEPRDVCIFELELFLEKGGISVLNQTNYPIDKGGLLFSKPGDVRYTHLPLKTYYIHFSVADSALAALLQKLPSFLCLSDYKEIKAAFLKIIAAFRSADSLERICASAQLVTLLESIRRFEINQSGEDISNRAKNYMNQNYSEGISVKEIAEHCNVSEPHLYRLFRESLHTTPNEYLLGIKLSGACRLLCNTDLSINEVAMDCGFTSQSYFADCFRRKIGLTPLQYRQAHRYKL